MYRIKFPLFCLVYALIIFLGLGLLLYFGFAEFFQGLIEVFLLKG